MLLRRLARPMLAAMFIQGGINALQAPQGHAQAAKPLLDAVAPAVDKVTEMAPIDQRPDDEMLIKIDAGVKVVAGTMLALGRFPRLASTALAASLVPTTLATHRFWDIDDEAERQAQQIHFLKNVGLLGGLLIAAADTGGKPSLGWRGRRAARLASAAVQRRTDELTGAAQELSGRLTGTAQQGSGAAAGLAAGLAGLSTSAGAAVSTRAKEAQAILAERGPEAAARAAAVRADLTRRAAKSAKRAEKRRAALQKAADKRGAELRLAAEKRSAALQKRAAKRGAQWQKQAARRRAELERRAPAYLDQVTTQASKLGHDVAIRASRVGAEVAHAAGGVADDARKRVSALSR
ncbi:MAG TPA: DoxX family membrane protein [Pseudonocardia sp.]|jgi:uncharacterized membrane protein YphA (DoxX/SURF4 family)|nr:DoxX family membrane protein [Pseudonocardia sp.]